MLERPPVYVPGAAAATSHPLATAAAVACLRNGGSAADAAVAAGAVLTVVEPWASQIGGDGFGLVWDAPEKRARAIQGSGAVPLAVDPTRFANTGSIPDRGAEPVTVPGMVGAWFHLLTTRGRLSTERVFADAVRLAQEGFPVGRRWEWVARIQGGIIRGDPGLQALFMRDGEPVRAGAWIRQPELAETLKQLARDGADAFYRGLIGARVVEEVRHRGGWLAGADLASHETEEVEPLSMEWAGCTVLEQPPVSQGVMVLAMLRFLEEADRRGMGIGGYPGLPLAVAREMHLQVESYFRVRADRDRWLGDPRFVKELLGGEAILERWLSREHAAEVVSGIDPMKASGGGPGTARESDTTYLCIADPDGSLVSWIQSIFHPFGAGWTVPGTGILLNNRMTGFSLDPHSPNRLEPGKRTVHTLNSWMVLRGGEPWLVGGTPGGEVQVQTNVQLLRSRVVHSVSLAETLQAPRWRMDDRDRLLLEGRGSADVRRWLRDRGHRVVRIGPWDGGGLVQALERSAEGGWIACTEPRGEGLAAGF